MEPAMNMIRLLASPVTVILSVATLMSSAPAQTQSPPARPKKPPVHATSPAPAPAPVAVAVAEQKCLRAIDGACTNPASVEAAGLRAEVIPAARVSYFGTPVGTIGGSYISFERLFQDNPFLFGLPTFTFVQPCCVTRTK
jgi:hypothetical protein